MSRCGLQSLLQTQGVFKGRPLTCHPCSWGAFLGCFAAACALVAYYLVICWLTRHNYVANKWVAVWLLLGFWSDCKRLGFLPVSVP
jgi:hypothetical protein